MEEMEISPRFLSPISEAAPWPLQQMPHITEGIPQYFPRTSPRLTPKAKTPKAKTPKAKTVETEFIFSPISEQKERKPFEKMPPGEKPIPRPSAPPKSRAASPPKRKTKPSVPKKRKPLKEMTLEEFLAFDNVSLLGGKISRALARKEPVAPILARESYVCSMIRNGKLSFGRFIKKGAQGSINELLFRGQKGRYVVKSVNPEQLVIPDCIEDRKLIWERTDRQGMTIFPKGSIICTPAASEFLIALIVGEFKKTFQSQNFMNTVYLASCYSNGGIENQYTLMEQVDGDINTLFKLWHEQQLRLTHEDIDSMYIQILHALHMCQTKEIVHGDLHTGNVLYENASNVSPELNNTKYFSYEINGKYLKIPAISYIMKLGDWGFAVKYSQPIVGNVQVVAGDFKVCPNFYTRSYDVAYITSMLFQWFPQNELLKRVMAWMMHCTINQIPIVIDNFFDLKDRGPRKEDKASGRPFPWTWATPEGFLHVSPDAILTNPNLMGMYLVNKDPKDAIRLDRPITPFVDTPPLPKKSAPIPVKPKAPPKKSASTPVKPKTPPKASPKKFPGDVVQLEEMELLNQVRAYNSTLPKNPKGPECRNIFEMYGRFWTNLTKSKERKYIRNLKELGAFRRETLKMFHPDKHITPKRKEWATEMTKELSTASVYCSNYLS